MTGPTVRGQATGLASVPAWWRGPLPDPSVRRDLPNRDGYATVPASLLDGKVSDLGVLVWTQLRLWFDDDARVVGYRDLAVALRMDGLSERAVEYRFGAALRQLIDGGWVERERVPRRNLHTYRAVQPAGSRRGRWAKGRRCDLALLGSRPEPKKPPIGLAELVDFLRWQVECGARGWTADPVDRLAGRWGLKATRFRDRRAALLRARLLTVVPRAGDSDLVWLSEVFDPHWMTASEPTEGGSVEVGRQPERPATGVAGGTPTPSLSRGSVPSGTPSIFRGSPPRFSVGRPPHNLVGPKKELLAGTSLTEPLADLGGASAPPLTSSTREAATAAHAPNTTRTSRAEQVDIDGPDPRSADKRDDQVTDGRDLVAGALLAAQPFLRSAPGHYRRAMVADLSRAVGAGLHPGHLEAALIRVVSAEERGQHCAAVRLAVRQAWADQKAGGCPDCGAAAPRSDGSGDGHRIGCPARPVGETDPDIIRILATASLASVDQPDTPAVGTGRSSSRPAPPADPLDRFLTDPVGRLPDPTGGQLVGWFATRLATTLAAVPTADRSARLQQAWNWWRARTRPDQHEALSLAAALVGDATRRAAA